MKFIFGVVVAVVLLIVAFAVFPMVLEGADAVNETTNATEYLGLLEIVNLSPALIFLYILGAALIGAGGWYVLKKRREG